MLPRIEECLYEIIVCIENEGLFRLEESAAAGTCKAGDAFRFRQTRHHNCTLEGHYEQ